MLVTNCTVMIFLILLVIETIDRCDSQALLWQEDKEGTKGRTKQYRIKHKWGIFYLENRHLLFDFWC